MQSKRIRRRLGALAIAAVGLGLWAPGTRAVRAADAAPPTPGSQWLTVNNRLDGQRFSPLRQITPSTVAQLGEVCRVQIDGPTTFHAGIVVVDNMLYTDTGLETVALDADNCSVRWRYSYVPEEERFSPSNRGLAVLDGRVFRGTGDGRLLALDAGSGKLLWKDVIGKPELGEAASAAPLAWQGVVYMGISGSELGARGRIMAFDAQTGRELWRFNTVPMGHERGADTWKRPASAKTGGGGVWGSFSLDVATGELFVPVGNPWPDIDTGYRPGSNLFTDSIVVLDARTGALKWWYQTTPADWQDRDLVAAPVLYRDAKVRDVLAFGGKDGFVTAVDRDTHQVIFRTPVTTVENAPAAPTKSGVRICPGYAGGVEWNGPTLDRLSNALITGAVDACFIVRLGTTHYSANQASFGGTVLPDGPVTGWVTALDADTGRVRWRYHAEKPVIAGITPTAGGVTFTGDIAGNLLVFDSKSGALLRKIATGGALAGGVVTYEIAGRQYVAFATGNVSRMAFGALGIPSVMIMALNPASGAPARAASTARPITSSEPGGGVGSPAEGADLARGARLYAQICLSCHGPNGNLIADHKLSDLSLRRDETSTIRYIEDPKPPMPKLYPDLLTEQNVLDVAAFVQHGLAP